MRTKDVEGETLVSIISDWSAHSWEPHSVTKKRKGPAKGFKQNKTKKPKNSANAVAMPEPRKAKSGGKQAVAAPCKRAK